MKRKNVWNSRERFWFKHSSLFVEVLTYSQMVSCHIYALSCMISSFFLYLYHNMWSIYIWKYYGSYYFYSTAYHLPWGKPHHSDVIMRAMASQVTGVSIVYSVIYSSADQRKLQSSPSLAFVRGTHRWPVNSPHKGPVTRKMFPFNDIIMLWHNRRYGWMLLFSLMIKHE